MQEIGFFIAAALISACVSIGAYHCTRAMLSELLEHMERGNNVKNLDEETVGNGEDAEKGHA